MLLHMRIRILSLIATILSLGVSVLFDRIEQELLKDIFIGVFTGAILTYITSFVSYRIERRNAFLGYLGALQAYRARFDLLYKNKLTGKTESVEQNIADLKLYFYDLHYNSYLKIEYICKNRKLPQKIDEIFELIRNVQIQINLNHFEQLEQMKQDIDCGICKLESVMRDLGYIDERKS